MTLQRVDGQISMTFDSWTSQVGDPFLSITAHYIDAPMENPQQWQLKCEQLAFAPIYGNRSGSNIARILVETIDNYNLRDKVSTVPNLPHYRQLTHIQLGWFTADNASNNGTAIKAVGKEIDPRRCYWDPVTRQIMCMEHCVHLGAKHFASDLAPTPRRQLQADGGADGDPDAEEDGEAFDAADALGKALALVTQIRLSPQARAFFKKCCRECGAPDLELLTWIRTRWASLYYFLDRIIVLKAVCSSPAHRVCCLTHSSKGVNRFTQLADESDEVPDLQKKSYAQFKLSKADWGELDIIREVLQACYIYYDTTRETSLISHIAGASKCSAVILNQSLPISMAHHPHSRIPATILGEHGRQPKVQQHRLLY
jgi:hypothetical protein